MFVQSNLETNHAHKNGLAIRQRRGNQETLVQWENGKQFWVPTQDLKSPETIRVIGSETNHSYDEGEL